MNYDYNPFSGANDFDYYGQMSVRDAKKAVSRTSLAIFLFGAVSSAVIFAICLAIRLAIGEDGYAALVENPYFYIPISTIGMYVIGFPFIWLCLRALPTRRRSNGNTLTIPEILAIIPISQFATNLGSTIGTGFDGILQEIFHKTTENPVENFTTGVPTWLMITVAVIIAPIVEEFIFRKLIIDRLSVYGNVFAIIISAALFGLFHGNLYQMFYAFFLGLLMGYLTVKGGSWLWGAGLHVFLNFVNGALPTILEGHFNNYETAMLAFLEGDGDAFIENFQSFMIAGSYAIIISMLSIAGAIILVYSIAKKLIYVKNAPEASIPVGKLPIVIFLNAGMLLFLLYSAFSVILQYTIY